MKSPLIAGLESSQAFAQDIGVDQERLIADRQSASVAEGLERSAAPALVFGRTIIQGRVEDKAILRVAEMEIEEYWTLQCQNA